MKRLQRKISVKADALRKKSLVSEPQESSFDEIALTETRSSGSSQEGAGEGAGAGGREGGRRTISGREGAGDVGTGAGAGRRKLSLHKMDRRQESPRDLEEGARRLERAHTVGGRQGQGARKVKEQRALEPVCGICYGEFSRPKLLPCGHSFCQLCLEKFVNPKLLVECPSCRKETQLSVLGVASLPDNTALKKAEKEDSVPAGGDEVEEEAFPAAPPCSLGPGLTEQLQMSFSKLREAEVGYRAGMEGLAEQIEQHFEKKVADLRQKQVEMEATAVKMLQQKLDKNESWRRSCEQLIVELEVASTGEEGADWTSLRKLVAARLRVLETLCRESVRLDPSSQTLVTVGRPKVSMSSPVTTRRKASLPSSPPSLSPEHYRLATLEEGVKIKWSSCLQPQCASICPWTGHLWVCASGSREVAVFGPHDSLVQTFTNPAFLFPCSIAFSEELQEAYILDKRQSIIFVVSPSFQVTGSLCKEGRKPGHLSSPTALVTDNRGRLVVADCGNDRVQVLKTDGSPLAVVGVSRGEEGGAVQELQGPQGLAISPDGKSLAVADTGNHRVRIYSANSGRPIHSFGSQGHGKGQFEKPLSVTWDSQGNLLVLDTEKIQVFSGAGDWLKTVQARESLNGLTVVASGLLMYDTYSVIRCSWRIK